MKNMIIELRNQKVPEDWIEWVLKRITKEKQILAMMQYLQTTKNKTENLNKLIFKTIEIRETIKN